MSSRSKVFLPVAIGTALALAMAILLIRSRYEVETVRETARMQALVHASGEAFIAELERGERELTLHSRVKAGSRWKPWHLDAAAKAAEQDDPAPISESALRRALAARAVPQGATVLVGPIATDRSGAAVVLARAEPHERGKSDWTVVWTLVDEVIPQASVAEMVRKGYRLQLYNVTDAAPVYQTDNGTLRAAIAQPLHFGGSRWELRAGPRSDLTILRRLLVPSLLIALAILLWPLYELYRGRALKQAVDDMAEAEMRRRELNARYGIALGRLADLESRLHEASMVDSITGLGNRSSLLRRIGTALDAMRQSGQGGVAVLAIGIDPIQQIRNSFGAGQASRILMVVAERLQSVLPSRDLLFGTGDLNLAVVLPGVDAAASAEVAHRIAAEIEAPVALDSHAFLLHPTIGIASASSAYERSETLLDHAGAALSALPRDAPVRYCLFDSATTRESVSRLQLEVDLDRAFEEQQLILEYEPLVVAESGAVVGFEALIRWNHPTEGRLSGGRFVPIAIQAGMAHRLNAWVLREAARQVALWRRAGHEELFVNVNLTAEAFLRPQLVKEVGAVLAEFDLPGRQLVVELTESALVQDMRAAARALQGLSDLGVGAWLDDFGTGYSSLAHLRSLPLKGVKVDRSFIEHIDVDARDFGVLKAVIDLLNYLGMQSVVEGIETISQYELLSLTRCDLYQGHYFARSMPAAEAESWMKGRMAGAELALNSERLPQRRQGSG